MSDRWVVACAGAAIAGAWVARPVASFVVFLVVVVAIGLRWPPAICLAVAVLASFLGARAWDGVRSAATRGALAGTATLVRDPEWVEGAVRAEVRVRGTRIQAYSRGDAAAVLSDLLAGERLTVRGELAPISGRSRGFLARRHIGSRLLVTEARALDRGGPIARYSNELRRKLVAGSDSLSPERRALYTGIVLGDDRDQTPTEVDDFRAAGLTHLLAVSGQNVAFVLAVVSPLLQRLRLRTRLVTGVAVLLFFGTLTRWEPSVLRAVAMAALALTAVSAGRQASPVRVLALACGALVLVDPMLAGSIGFLLSVGACAGIALLSPLLDRAIPSALSVTVAAQAGVAPILLAVFGGVPLASLPANLLAVPAAGPLMMWGLAAGVPAGLIGGRVAAVLHVPTRLLLWWIAGVAHVSAALPLPQLTARSLPVAAFALLCAGIVWRTRRTSVIVGVAVAAVAGVLVVAGARRDPVDEARQIAAGVRLWRSEGTSVLEITRAEPSTLLPAMRGAGIRRVDVLVLTAGGPTAAKAASFVRHRARVGVVLAPAGHSVPGAITPPERSVIRAGAIRLEVASIRPRLRVRITSHPDAARAGYPPP